jgi:hypothetical protein
MSDTIEHPPHYTYSEFEPRDIIPAWTEHSSEAWLVGAALKYLCRSGAPLAVRKAPEIEDWKKARQVLTIAIHRAEPVGYEGEPDPIGPPQGRDCSE